MDSIFSGINSTFGPLITMVEKVEKENPNLTDEEVYKMAKDRLKA